MYMLEFAVRRGCVPRTMRIMVAGSVPRRSARARTLNENKLAGAFERRRMMACRFGLNSPRRA